MTEAANALGGSGTSETIVILEKNDESNTVIPAQAGIQETVIMKLK